MELRRTLNLFDATSIGIWAIIGAGIVVVLALAKVTLDRRSSSLW